MSHLMQTKEEEEEGGRKRRKRMEGRMRGDR